MTAMEQNESEDEGEDEIAEDLNDIEEPSGPRTNLKVNADLDACLMKSSKPTIRGSLASGRALTFDN